MENITNDRFYNLMDNEQMEINGGFNILPVPPGIHMLIIKYVIKKLTNNQGIPMC